MVLAAVVGLLAGFGSLAVRFLISVVTGLSFGAGEGLLLGGTSVPWWRLLLMPALGGLVVGPVIWYLARGTRGSGVPEVMAAVLLRQGRIRPRVAAVKTLVSPITIGSGGSAGREGPMAQIGATLGSMVGGLSRLPPRGVKTLVAAGAAGGIAAAFNAPIGGSLFALEIVLGDFAVSAFSPVVISAVAATVVSRAFEGDFTAFHVPIYELRSAWEFVPYGLLGIGAGLVAVVFVMLLYQQERFWERLPFPEPMKPALGGLMVGALGVFAPPILGSGYAGITGGYSGRRIRLRNLQGFLNVKPNDT